MGLKTWLKNLFDGQGKCPPDLNFERISYCLDYAMAVYRPNLNNPKILLDKMIAGGRMIIYAHSQKTCVIAFRGIQFSDIATGKVELINAFEIELAQLKPQYAKDYTFLQRLYKVNKYDYDYDNIKVHYGFLQVFNSFKQDILKVLGETKYANVVFTGHSKGGAIAKIAAGYFVGQAMDVSFVSFGSPKVGNVDFKNYINSRILEGYNIIVDDDNIPSLPPKSAYTHVGTVIRIDENGKVIKTLSNTMMLFNYFNWARFRDHGTESYIHAVLSFYNNNKGAK